MRAHLLHKWSILPWIDPNQSIFYYKFTWYLAFPVYMIKKLEACFLHFMFYLAICLVHCPETFFVVTVLEFYKRSNSLWKFFWYRKLEWISIMNKLKWYTEIGRPSTCLMIKPYWQVQKMEYVTIKRYLLPTLWDINNLKTIFFINCNSYPRVELNFFHIFDSFIGTFISKIIASVICIFMLDSIFKYIVGVIMIVFSITENRY